MWVSALNQWAISPACIYWFFETGCHCVPGTHYVDQTGLGSTESSGIKGVYHQSQHIV